MKKGLKILVVLLLIGCLAFEGWFFLHKKSTKTSTPEDPLASKEEINEDDKKYVVDSLSKYKNNDLSYSIKEDGIYRFVQIEGLKDKEVEKKINKAIEDRIKVFTKEDLTQPDYDEGGVLDYKCIVALPYSSFANTISIRIGLTYNDKVTVKDNFYYMLDAVNYELKNGEEIKITDVLLSPQVLREDLVNSASENIYKNIGIICGGGPCNNPNPHYERVEDSVMSVINQFNNGNYTFYFNATELYLLFKDSYINAPFFLRQYSEEKLPKEKYEGCEEIVEEDEEDKYYTYLCNDNYTKRYLDSFYLGNYLSNVIIYNKFVTEESLFTKSEQKEFEVFTDTEKASLLLYEDGDNLYDFALNINDIEYEYDRFLSTKKLVIEESKELKTGDKNIWRITHGFKIFKNEYQYYVVYHYQVPANEYDEVKKQIYDYRAEETKDFDKSKSYPFLEKYKTKDAYYFYVLTESGKETNIASLINSEYEFDKVIPESWLSKGKYKTVKDLVNSMFIVCDTNYKFKDRLVLYITHEYYEGFYENHYKLSYQGEEIDLDDIENESLMGYNIFKE
jgi:hypothetical protein